jgi:hypothetical protein
MKSPLLPPFRRSKKPTRDQGSRQTISSGCGSGHSPENRSCHVLEIPIRLTGRITGGASLRSCHSKKSVNLPIRLRKGRSDFNLPKGMYC